MREKIKNYENLAPAQKELIDRVRRDLGKYGAQLSDEQILEHWDGSLELTTLELHWSWVELKRAIKAAARKPARRIAWWWCDSVLRFVANNVRNKKIYEATLSHWQRVNTAFNLGMWNG